MKTHPLLTASTFFAVCVSGASSLYAQQKAPRTVQVSATTAPPVIRTLLNESTLLELPAEEKVATIFGGNTDDWIFNAGHVASRFVSVKPKAAAAKTSTNVHIISDHGNDYTLVLQEVSADQAGGFDATVFLEQTDKDAQKKMADAPVFVPAAEVKEKEDRLEREVAQAKAAAAADKQTAEIARRNTRAPTPATCTLITAGTSPRRRPWVCGKSGMTGSSPTSRASSRSRPLSTS